MSFFWQYLAFFKDYKVTSDRKIEVRGQKILYIFVQFTFSRGFLVAHHCSLMVKDMSRIPRSKAGSGWSLAIAGDNKREFSKKIVKFFLDLHFPARTGKKLRLFNFKGHKIPDNLWFYYAKATAVNFSNIIIVGANTNYFGFTHTTHTSAISDRFI